LAIGAGQPIRSGQRLKFTPDFHIKSRDEVYNFFADNYPDQADEFCDNSLFFANQCEEPDWISPKYSNPSGHELPDFPVKDQPDYQEFKNWLPQSGLADRSEDVAYIRFCCQRALSKKAPPGKLTEYQSRLDMELEIFEMKNLSSYMLIVADYVNWAKNNGVSVGPGRGSAGSSLAAWFLDIHKIDPLKYNLPFERFYSKAKVGLSDIDCDFSQEGKPKVEEYVIKKYGREFCAQVSNYSSLSPKPYAKAISRVFQYGGDAKAAVAIGNAIAQAIPKDIKFVEQALTDAPLFAAYAESEKYHHLKKYAKDIGNKPYNLAIHAGALIIGKRHLADIVPVRISKDGIRAIEYEKERAEENGLAKMDLLGVSTLDVLDIISKLIKEQGKTLPHWDKEGGDWDYDLNDPETYKLIGSGNLYGVFQLGKSGGTINICKLMQPQNLEDLAMINAMARPGFPKEVQKDFIDAKNGLTEVTFKHPILTKSLTPTFGFALYDEVLLQLAADFAGWDLAEADRLRKFVKDKGKHPEKDKKVEEDMLWGAVNKVGLSPEDARMIWDEVIGRFASYAFNKSHSIAYSMLSYETAYLKAHFPLEFLIGNLIFQSASNALDSEDNIKKAKSEIRRLNVKILPPDINTSERTYKIVNEKTVLTGFDALKFMGKDAIPEILANRPFTSFEDFLSRVDGRKVNSRSVQALIASGCLDSFGMSRKQMFLHTSDYKKKISVWLKRKNKDASFNYPWPEDKSDWNIPEKYAMENFYLGEGLTGDKLRIYPGFFNSSAPKFSDFSTVFPDPQEENNSHPLPKPIQGEIISFFEFKVKKEESKSFGKNMAKVLLEDPWNNQMSMTVFANEWPKLKDRIKVMSGGKSEIMSGVGLHARVALNWYNGEIGMVYQDLLKVTKPPSKPIDLEHRKVSMKLGRGKKKDLEEATTLDIIEEVDDELIEEGLETSDDLDMESVDLFPDIFN
jgi:DNA polymerase-3 subunit alpha